VSTRRPNGDSWIPDRPDGAGNWHGKVSFPPKADGSPDRRHVQRKTKAARDKAVRDLVRQRDAGILARAARPKTVRQMLDRHLTVVLPQRGRAPATINGYRSLCTFQIYPRWGGQRIDRITPEMLEDGYAEMLAASLAAATVRKVHALLSSAFKIEFERQNIARNPALLAEPPRVEQADKTALTIDQARAVLAASAGQRNAARWSVGLGCGLRQGEALGLRWQYVDLSAGLLQVWYQLQRLPWRHACADAAACCAGKHRQACPKRCPKIRPSGRPHVCIPAGAPRLCPPGCTGHAMTCPERTGGGLIFREIKERRRKTIPLPSPLVAALRAHRAEQNRERLAAANIWQNHGLVFAQPDGSPIDPRADWGAWGQLLTAAGIAHAGTHAMRHTAATIGLDQGTALAVVQELLGHSDIRVTRGYAHVSSALAADGAERLGSALFGPTVPVTVPGKAGQ
jgi:integrase